VLIVREAPVAYTGDTLSRTRAAARDRSTVMVVQGRDTLIAAPDGRAILHPPGPSTTDADDVLNAIIQRLLAQGMPAFSAAAVCGCTTPPLPSLAQGCNQRMCRDCCRGCMPDLHGGSAWV
jgi:NAD(P)H-hydrate repair Nnr-like enzyme with NAD(P)H-hydrate dehydratase domain